MPSFDDIKALYDNDPQQYQALVASADALSTIFNSPELRAPLGEQNSPYLFSPAQDRGSYLTCYANEFPDEAILEYGETSLERFLQANGSLQAYLTGRPEPYGPTRYEIVKDFVRRTQGQQSE